MGPYDTEGWALEAPRGRRIFNHNVRMLGDEVPGWSLVETQTLRPRLPETVYLWEGDDAPEGALIRVDVAEAADWRLALDLLAELLGRCMRPNMPRATGRLAALGDIAYVARERRTDIPASIMFSRGNIVVVVSSAGSATVDVSSVAGTVDRLLAGRPQQDASSPRHQVVRAMPVTAEAGEEIVLHPDLSQGEDIWLKAIALEGELRREGPGLLYRAAEAGTRTVELFMIGARPAAPHRRSSRFRWRLAIILIIGSALLLLSLLFLG
jgi:hypothetical protein